MRSNGVSTYNWSILLTVALALCVHGQTDNLASSSKDRSAVDRLVKVAAFFDNLRVCGKLPLLDPSERGQAAHGVEVDENFKNYYSGEGGLTQSMRDDIAGRTNCFVVMKGPSEEVGLGHRFYFFQSHSDDSVQFLSAYHSVSNRWIRLRSIQTATNEFADLEVEVARWKMIRQAFSNALDRASVPSLTKAKHPDPTVYALTKELQQEWLKNKKIDVDMLIGPSKCPLPYACMIRTDSGMFLCFFCLKNKEGQATLVSAYRTEGRNWERIQLVQ